MQDKPVKPLLRLAIPALELIHLPDITEEYDDDFLQENRRELDAQNQQMRSEQFQQRLAAQERQTQARIDSAMQRELLKQRGQ